MPLDVCFSFGAIAKKWKAIADPFPGLTPFPFPLSLLVVPRISPASVRRGDANSNVVAILAGSRKAVAAAGVKVDSLCAADNARIHNQDVIGAYDLDCP